MRRHSILVMYSSLAEAGFEEVEPGWVEDTQENRERVREIGRENKEPGWRWNRVADEEHFGLIRVWMPNEQTEEEAKRETGRRDLLVNPRDQWSDFKEWQDLPLDPAAPGWVKGRLVAYRRREDAGEPQPINSGFPVRCTHVKHDGSRCWLWAGNPVKSTLCTHHIDPSDETGRLGRARSAGASYETLLARRNLKKLAANAVDTMEELLNHAENETVRARMAEAILDRVGIRPGVEIDATVTEVSATDPADEIRNRLSRLIPKEPEPAELEDPSIIDAEVIETETTDDDR